jgi:phosphatidylinositol-3-phosphatase
MQRFRAITPTEQEWMNRVQAEEPPLPRRALRSKVLLPVSLLMAVLVMPAWPASRQSGLSSIKTVFIILFENTNWASITPSVAPYIRTTVVPMGAHATQYFNPLGTHPSEPNYIWLEAGDDLGLTTDKDASPSNSTSTKDHLVRHLENAGISWKTYQEDIDGTTCPLTSGGFAGSYAAKHNPFVFFRDLTDNNNPNSSYCIAHNRPFAELATDLRKNTIARYNFITPNLCNDMHDCGITAGDTWLSQTLPVILNSRAYRDNGAVFITWDEGAGGSDGPIGMVVVSPLAKANYSNSIYYTHSSTLRTMQEIFRVRPFLRDAANATDLSDLFADGGAGGPGKSH